MKTAHSLFIALAIFTSLTANALSFGSTSCDYTPISDTDYATLTSNYAQSADLLSQSQSLLAISAQMLNNPASVNITYVEAMLRLSDDIGTMADRIGEMADRIVSTELQIGIMADRILDTQRLQNENVALTQANLLKAQENFNNLLIQLAN